MAEIVNLRQMKKQAARKAARSLADAKAVKYGRTKPEREQEKARADKEARHLDAHRRETE